jgi:hypothetical protein
VRLRRWWIIGGLVLLAPAMAAGCTAPGAYQGSPAAGSYSSDIPPSWYGGNPQYRQWYTAPYWMPDVDQ